MDSILERINSFNENNLDFIQYYKSDINIDYDDFLNVWYNYLKKTYLENNKIVDFTDEYIKSIFKIIVFEPILGEILESYFTQHMYDPEDSLIVVYIKGSEKVLLLYKSYEPLLTSQKIKLPFWELLIESKQICEKLNEDFEEGENICILTYS